MTTTATVWLAYEITRSPFVAGLLAFANQIPLLLLAPVGGLIGDRADKRQMLIKIQAICALLSAGLAAAVFCGQASVSALIAFATMRGLINATEYPTRQSYIINLVGSKDDLPNAIALNSAMFNVARLIGPSVAGAMIIFSGPAWCFILDSLSFLGAMASLMMIRTAEPAPRTKSKHPIEELRDGLRYARNHPMLRASLLLVSIVSFSGFAATVLAPVFAKDVFHGDAMMLGIILSAMGVGALASALSLGSRISPAGLSHWIERGAILVVVAQIGFALSTSVVISILFLIMNGAGVVLVLAGSNTLIQSLVEDSMRGRVMGLFVMGQGFYPLGSLMIGTLATAFGARWSVGICATITLIAALMFYRMVRQQKMQPATNSCYIDASPSD
jgi:MFS family permease